MRLPQAVAGFFLLFRRHGPAPPARGDAFPGWGREKMVFGPKEHLLSGASSRPVY